MTLEKQFVELIKTKNRLKLFDILRELNCSCEWAFNAVKRLIDARFAKVLGDSIEFYVENLSSVKLRILLGDSATKYGEGRITFLGRTLTNVDIENLEFFVKECVVYQDGIKTERLLKMPYLKGALNSIKNLITYQLVVFEDGVFTPTLDVVIFSKIKTVYEQKLKTLKDFYEKNIKEKVTFTPNIFENFLTYFWYGSEYQAVSTKEELLQHPYELIKPEPLISDKEYLKLSVKRRAASVSTPFSYFSFVNRLKAYLNNFLKNNNAVDIVLVNEWGKPFHMIIDPKISVVEIFTQAVKAGATASFFIGKNLSKMEFVEYILDKCVYFEAEDSFNSIPITGETKFVHLLDFDVVMAMSSGRPLRIKVWVE
ncbi:MAG: hypothetical protein IJF75_02305 [Clostridia bacterium]|nr:hypothetical protein [Clostridia bacterium]